MNSTELQILASPPNFEYSLETDELRILLAESHDRLNAKEREINRLLEEVQELKSDRPSCVPWIASGVLVLAIGLLAILAIDSFYQWAKSDGIQEERERTAQQMEALKRTYCLSKHKSASSYQACINSI